MIRFIRRKLMAATLLMLLLLSACQPIQPEAAQVTQECTDADKIALLQTYEERFLNRDAAGVTDLFTDDAVFAFDPSPYLDRATGKYKVPFVVHVEGQEGIRGIFDVLNTLDAGVMFDTPRVSEDVVIASGKETSSLAVTFGQPTTEISGTQMIIVRDCKIATARFIISQAALDALPAAAAAAAAKCEDSYKSAIFQRFVNGLWNFDLELASLPWAEDAVFRFDGLPHFDAATKTYVIDPAAEQKTVGLSEIQQVLEQMMAQQTEITLAMESQQIKGATLTISDTTTQSNPLSEFQTLPLTELAGIFTATFNDQCEIAVLDHIYPEETLRKLTEAKAGQ